MAENGRHLKFESSSEAQKLALDLLLNDNTISHLWFWWGAGWGKSYTGVFWQWSMRMTYPWTKGFFWRKELKNLKKTTLETYYKMCNDYNIPHIQRGRYIKDEWAIVYDMEKILWPEYKNVYSKIYLLDLSHMPSDPLYTRLGSLELTDWFIDESNEIHIDCITILHTRVWRQFNDRFNILPKILETFNPDKGHVYRRYWLPFKNEQMAHNYLFIPSLAKDNNKVDRAYIKALEEMPEWPQKERLLRWNFDYDDTPWRLFADEKIADLFSNYGIETGERYVIWDVARKWEDLWPIFVFDWFKLIDYHIFWQCKTTEYSDKINDFRRRYRIGMSSVAVDEDWVWGWVVDQLWCKWVVNNSRPLPVWYDEDWKPIIPNFEHLKAQLYFKLAEIVASWEMDLSILPDKFKDMLFEELWVMVEKDQDKDWKVKIITKEEVKGKIWRSPDIADTLAYRMLFEIKPPEKFTFTIA